MVRIPIKPPPVAALLILDGWGVAAKEPGNAIAQAKTPVFDDFIRRFPVTVLKASGESVGLPWGSPGGSEAGHVALGTGRFMMSDIVRINEDIWSGKFFQNKALLAAANHTRRYNSSLHLVGLVSSFSGESSLDHLYALIDFAKKKHISRLYLHLIVEGPGTSLNISKRYIERVEERLYGMGIGALASIHGSWYAMDRDSHWSRTEESYRAIAEGVSRIKVSSSSEVFKGVGEGGVDENLRPSVIIGKSGKMAGCVEDRDAIIFFNLRGDKMRQLVSPFVYNSFNMFKRARDFKNLFILTFTEYDADFKAHVAWRNINLKKGTLAETFSETGWPQLHIAETEKYAHVTYFFNGLNEAAHKDEAHALVPSKSDTTYEESPEMSAREIGQRMVEEIGRGTYRFILANFANADVVAHTGNLGKTIEAVSAIDREIGIISEAVLLKGGMLFITSDHGNAESVVDITTGRLNKSHTGNPVPFLIIGREFEGKTLGFDDAPGGDLSFLKPSGLLSDVAPTILKFCGLKKPVQMIGRSLV